MSLFLLLLCVGIDELIDLMIESDADGGEDASPFAEKLFALNPCPIPFWKAAESWVEIWARLWGETSALS